MSQLDLREIPATDPVAGAKGGQFEFFARDFLSALGYEILEGPDRGQDDGRDLLVAEPGSITGSRMRWLVSVKHFAHSGKSVGTDDELDPEGRISHFGASGFMAFYSTLPSSPLVRRLRSLEDKRVRWFVYDAGLIGMKLLSEPALGHVFKHYLTRGYATLHSQMISNNALHITTEIGVRFPRDEVIALELSEFLDRDSHGRLRIADEELEDVMTACVLADALCRGCFGILARFASFRPVVWRYLSHFIEVKGLNAKALAAAIEEARSLRARNSPEGGALWRVGLDGFPELTGAGKTLSRGHPGHTRGGGAPSLQEPANSAASGVSSAQDRPASIRLRPSAVLSGRIAGSRAQT